MPISLNEWIPENGGVKFGFPGKSLAGSPSLYPTQVNEPENDDEGVDESGNIPAGGRPGRRSSSAMPPGGLMKIDSEVATVDTIYYDSPPQSPHGATVTMVKSPRSIAAETVGLDNDGSAYLKRLIQSQLGREYRLVATVRRMQMRLRVYVHEKIVEVNNVTSGAELTGGALGGLPNKGGLVVSIRVKGTTLCFTSAHLAAHEGEEYRLRRNQDARNILRRALGKHEIDLDIQSFHTFFFGDLNYRLVPAINEELKALSWEEQRVKIIKVIEKKDWESLAKMDELQRELDEGRCLNGFQTPPCNFPPTFKVARYKEEMEYNTKRLPSYCDRILMKSMPGLEDRLKLRSYEPCPGFLSSDHKPLRGLFEVDLLPHVSPVNDGYPRLIFYNLSAVDLPIMDKKTGGLTDAYLLFQTNPAPFLLNKRPVKTSVIKRELNPTWSNEEVVVLVGVDSETPLEGIFVQITGLDWDAMSTDDVIGYATPLSLHHIVEATKRGERIHEFELTLWKGGCANGRIKGKVRIEWPSEGEYFKEHRRSMPSCCNVA